MGTEDLVSRIIFFILFIPPLSDSHHKFRIVGIRMSIKGRIWCQDLKHVLSPLKPHHVQTFFHRRWRRECGMTNQFRYAFLLRRRYTSAYALAMLLRKIISCGSLENYYQIENKYKF